VKDNTKIRLIDCRKDDITGRCPAVQWSPDGKWVEYDVDIDPMLASRTTIPRGLFLMDTSCLDQPTTCPQKSRGPLGRLGSGPPPRAWSPDGKYLAYVSDTGKTYVKFDILNAQQGQIERSLTVEGVTLAALESLSWSPDGQWLVFNQRDGIYLASVKDGKTQHISKMSVPDLFWVKVSP
jgi:Tol biopolymer transport system component